jgi:hypothetical protein
MKIVVRTVERLTDWALGKLLIEGEFQVWTRETAVFNTLPVGVFVVTIEHSERFGQKVPIILGIPGFRRAAIIPKVPPVQMDGDILVGLHWHQGGVSGTTGGFNLVFDRIQRATNDGEGVTLEIVR